MGLFSSSPYISNDSSFEINDVLSLPSLSVTNRLRAVITAHDRKTVRFVNDEDDEGEGNKSSNDNDIEHINDIDNQDHQHVKGKDDKDLAANVV